MDDEPEEAHNNDCQNQQDISKLQKHLSSCFSSAGHSCSSSSNTESSLKSLENFERTRHLYVVGCRFFDLVKELLKSTKIDFKIIEQSDKYGIIHFQSPISSALIYRINKNEGLGLQLYASRRIRQTKCKKELLLHSQTYMEDELEEEERSNSDRSLSLKNKIKRNKPFKEGQFQEDSYEKQLFYEMSSLLLTNLSWGLCELYNYVMTTSIMDHKRMTTAAMIFSNRKKLFSQVLDGRQYAVSSKAKQFTTEKFEMKESSSAAHQRSYTNSQLPLQLFSFTRNDQDLAEINETKTTTHTQPTQSQEITATTVKMGSETITYQKQTTQTKCNISQETIVPGMADQAISEEFCKSNNVPCNEQMLNNKHEYKHYQRMEFGRTLKQLNVQTSPFKRNQISPSPLSKRKYDQLQITEIKKEQKTEFIV